MSRIVVLVRHAESTKNAHARFSASDGSEELTERGLLQLASIKNALANIDSRHASSSVGVFCSPTARCVATASELNRSSHAIPIENLAPIRSPYPGLVEDEVSRLDPEFMRLLKEYRKCLRSAYTIPRGEGEGIRDFEQRVMAGMSHVLSLGHELNIVVGHRSTITATLLTAARTLTGYPSDWYGHLTIPIGSISVVEFDEDLHCSGFGPLCDVSFAGVGDENSE